MWFGTKWCLIQEEIIAQVSCKEHRHERLEILQHGIWSFPSADYYTVEIAVRLEVLRPFLFENSYNHSIFSKWILEMGLIPRGNFIENDEYNTETLEYIRVFDAIAVQVTRILNTIEITSEESGCSALKTLLIKHRGKSEILSKFANLKDAINYLGKDPLFRILMKNADISPVCKENVWACAYIISYCAYFNLDTLSKPPEISRSLLYLNDTGNDYFKDEEYDAAISTYTEIIKQNRYSDIIYSNRAETYLRTEKWLKAEVDATRAITLNPTRCEFYRKLALALEGQGKVHLAHVRAQEGQMLCEDPLRCPIYRKLHSTFQSLNSRCLATADCSGTKGGEISTTPSKSGDLSLPELLDDSEEDEEPLRQNSINRTNVEEAPRRAKVDERRERKTSEEKGIREKNGCQNSSGNSTACTIGELIKMFESKTERGSRFILAKNEARAIEEFEEALKIANSLEELGHLVDEKELMALKYALGMSLSAAGDFDNLQKALTYFEDLKKRHNPSEFPALFYGLGLVLVKLFRFEEAMAPLIQSSDLVKESKVLKRYNWPGTDTVIDETINERLQEKVSELINECRYAPKPDAVCRSTECPFTRNIYYRDPNIKGCYRLFCVGNCRIEYHSQCWKSVRDEKEKTEKDFLDSLCLTPDCGNVVYLIQIISQDGEIQKTFESSINGKRKVTKHRKSKLERKTETRDLKKRKKLEKVQKPFNELDRGEDDNERDDSFIRPNDVEAREIGDANPVEDSAMENLPVNNNPILYDVNSEPHYVFKKEDSVESDNARVKPSKTRETKSKPKKNVIGIDEFCKDAILDSASNPYLERVQRLQINKELMEEIDIISEHRGMNTFNSIRAKDRTSSFDEGTEEMSNSFSLKTIEREEKPNPHKKAEEPILNSSHDIEVSEQPRDEEPTDISKERATDVVEDERAFQLQVTLLALPEELRMNLIAGIINNFPNKSNFLEKLNKMADCESLFKESQNGEIDGPSEMASHIDSQIASQEIEELKENNNKLENELVNLRDINVRLNNTHSVVKNTLEREIRDMREKLRNQEIELKNSQVSHETELKRSSQEKRKILEEIKVIKKENENYVNLKRMADELFKRLEESQSEIASFKNLSESLSFTNSNLYGQLDNCQVKMKKALECLIEERRQMGSLVMKIEIEKTRTSLQQIIHELASTYPNSVELARLENSREIRKKRLDNLLKAEKDFSEKMNECSRSLKANEDDFQIDDIPPLPVAPSLPEAKAPPFLYPNPGGQGYLTNLRPPLLPNSTLTNFYYVPPALNGTMPRTLSQPPGIKTPSPTMYESKVSPVSSRPSSTNSYDRPTPIETPSTSAKSSYEKIVQIIKRKLPYLSESEIIFYIKQYRGLGMRFGGKRNEEIANTMVNYILDQKASNQKLQDEKKPKGALKDLSGVGEISDVELISSKKWKVNDSGMGGNFSSNDCSICMEPLSEDTKFQAECGHSCFHEKCVRPWLIEKSSCPICRKYLLLPDEFPKL